MYVMFNMENDKPKPDPSRNSEDQLTYLGTWWNMHAIYLPVFHRPIYF